MGPCASGTNAPEPRFQLAAAAHADPPVSAHGLTLKSRARCTQWTRCSHAAGMLFAASSILAAPEVLVRVALTNTLPAAGQPSPSPSNNLQQQRAPCGAHVLRSNNCAVLCHTRASATSIRAHTGTGKAASCRRRLHGARARAGVSTTCGASCLCAQRLHLCVHVLQWRGCGVTELTGGMHCTYPCIWVALAVPQVGLQLSEWLLTPRVAVVWLSWSSCFLLS